MNELLFTHFPTSLPLLSERTQYYKTMRPLYLNGHGHGTPCLTEYLHKSFPPYAILSHTWGRGEVTFKDIQEGTAKTKTGYDKICFCGKTAAGRGLKYFWVDTCCIDKSNSTELQEVINSMYRWYRDATRCYAYLSDVPVLNSDQSNSSSTLL